MLVFLMIILSTSSLKKRENMPYTSLGQMFVGRQILDGRLITLISLYICEDSSIRSLFGCLVPLGSIESPVIAMSVMHVVQVAVQ